MWQERRRRRRRRSRVLTSDGPAASESTKHIQYVECGVWLSACTPLSPSSVRSSRTQQWDHRTPPPPPPLRASGPVTSSAKPNPIYYANQAIRLTCPALFLWFALFARGRKVCDREAPGDIRFIILNCECGDAFLIDSVKCPLCTSWTKASANWRILLVRGNWISFFCLQEKEVVEFACLV